VCREGFLDAVTGDGGAHWQVPSCVNNLVLILIKFIKKKIHDIIYYFKL
jgi:hypothetical protein